MKKIIFIIIFLGISLTSYATEIPLIKLKTRLNSNGSLSYSTSFEYDQNHNLIYERDYDRDNKQDSYYFYEYSNNKLTKRQHFNVIRKGDTAGAFVYQEDKEELYGYQLYLYDEKSGLLEREDSLSSNGEIRKSVYYEYSQDGLIVKKSIKDQTPNDPYNEREYTSIYIYNEGRLYRVDQYDSNNNLISYSYRLYKNIEGTRDYVVTQSIVFKEDRFMNVEDEDYIFSWMKEYDYDENGLLLEEKSFDILTYIKDFSGSIKYTYY